MSNWSDIDKEIIKFEVMRLYFEDDFEKPPEEQANLNEINSNKITSKEIERLPDSDDYIKCLEKKLERLTVKNSNAIKSKDIINSLISRREAMMSNLLHDDHSAIDNCDLFTNDDEEEATKSNFINKLIYPLTKQGLTIQEVEALIKSDYLAKVTELNEQNDAEKSNSNELNDAEKLNSNKLNDTQKSNLSELNDTQKSNSNKLNDIQKSNANKLNDTQKSNSNRLNDAE